jgi:hypothetical protein
VELKQNTWKKDIEMDSCERKNQEMWFLNKAVLDHLASQDALASGNKTEAAELYLSREMRIRQVSRFSKTSEQKMRTKVLLIARDASKQLATA